MNGEKSLYKKIGSYSEKDVMFLLKDLSDVELEGPVEEREKRIQQGEHYSETLPIEYQPPKEYMEVFFQTLNDYKRNVALYAGAVAELILKEKGDQTVLISLARAGTPAGILIKRYLLWKYNVDLPHYSISIIRGRGIDANALHYIIRKHGHTNFQFIDGWTGKGAISIELTASLNDFHSQFGIKLDDRLAVIADPGRCTTLFGTRDDFLIPSACLNSTVSGLVSRTVLNKKYIGPTDFHGAKYYKELEKADLSNEYLDVITEQFPLVAEEIDKVAEKLLQTKWEADFSGMKTVEKIMEDYQIENIHFVKPGVGETTRVLLRRIPWKVLVKDLNSPYLKHILLLAKERNVEIEEYPHMEYTCCGLIKNVGEGS